jgi:hypothetical protein
LINAAAAVFFAAFVALALFTASRGRAAARLLVTYVVVLTLAVAFVQLDFWPFSAWPLIALYHPAEASHVRLAVVDARGVEHPLDARATGAVSFPELMAWADGPFARLDERGKRTAFAWLLDSIESSREHRVRTGRFPVASAPLGPLTSPRFLMAPRFWDGAGAPREKLVGLRLYRDRWNLEERARNATARRSTLVYEYRSAR